MFVKGKRRTRRDMRVGLSGSCNVNRLLQYLEFVKKSLLTEYTPKQHKESVDVTKSPKTHLINDVTAQ